ncbi:DeoR family transcriptional regulator [Patescibacteria group bacterium]|nr:DeoR family transcriptional regulator [Patescibacteria group bacterium]
MPQSNYLEITSVVCKLLEFFPEDEAIRDKAKEKALEIMKNLVLVSSPEIFARNKELTQQTLTDIEVLKGYLSLGKNRGWMNNMNLLILFKEYDQIKEEIKPASEIMQRGVSEEKKIQKVGQIIPVDNIVDKTISISGFVGPFSDRQQKIIEIMNNQEKVQVADLKNILSDISKRTLRRDLDDLLKKGKITRSGEWNQVFYKIYKKPLSGILVKKDISQNNIENKQNITTFEA